MILYAGTFESYQGIGMLLEAFALARREVPDAFLLLLGGQDGQVDEARRTALRPVAAGGCRLGRCCWR